MVPCYSSIPKNRKKVGTRSVISEITIINFDEKLIIYNFTLMIMRFSPRGRPPCLLLLLIYTRER